MILSHIYINLVMRSSLSKVVFSTVESWIVQYSTVQYSTVQYSAVQCSTVQYCRVRSVETSLVGPDEGEVSTT